MTNLHDTIAALQAEVGLHPGFYVDPWHLLRDEMSEISEDMVCAGWEIGLEFILWTMVIDAPNGSRRYVTGDVAACDLLRLAKLARDLGGWVIWDDNVEAVDGGCQRFIPMAEWLAMYELVPSRWHPMDEHERRGLLFLLSKKRAP